MVRIAKGEQTDNDTSETLGAAVMLLQYAGAFPQYGYLPPAPPPSVPDEAEGED